MEEFLPNASFLVGRPIRFPLAETRLSLIFSTLEARTFTCAARGHENVWLGSES